MKTIAKKGFTLIELLIVIAIIGILAVAFLPSLLDAPAKARDTQRIANVQAISNALTNDFLGGVAYPGATECVGETPATWANIIPTLGGAIPTDPQTTNTMTTIGVGAGTCTGEYSYVAAPSTDYSYGIYTHLENDTGNIACDADGLITAANDVTLSDNGNCYVLLVQ